MKALVFFLSLAVCMPASAAIKFTNKKLVDNPYFIPKDFTLNKESVLYFCDDENKSESYEFIILDKEFNEISKFSTPIYPEVKAEYSRAGAIDGPLDVTITSTSTDPWYESAATKEEFATACAQNGYSVIENRDNETWYLCDPKYDYMYYYYEIFGKKYPKTVYIWDNTTNKGYVRNFSYTYESWGFTGQYYEPVVEEDSYRPYPVDIEPKDANCIDRDYFIISQTLFNNDENLEWVVPVFEAVDCSYTNDYEKVEGKKVYATGFRVESQNGSVIASIKFPDGLVGDRWVEPYLYMINEKNYLLFDVFNIGEANVEYYIVYEIDASNASVKAIGAPRRISVNPTLPHRGTNVNITLANPADVTCKVIVTSVSGQTVMTRNIEPGQTSTTIDTARLEKGMYVISVSDGKTTHENTKIILK